MAIFLPRMTVSLVMWLAALIAATGTLYLALMPESVSPATTVWMMAAPFTEAGGLGVVRVGLASGRVVGMASTLGVEPAVAEVSS